jgi:hypothetical protein
MRPNPSLNRVPRPSLPAWGILVSRGAANRAGRPFPRGLHRVSLVRWLRGLAFVRALALSFAAALLAAACDEGLDPSSDAKLASGTWGGENAGVIVSDTLAHVHVGCTFGNFRLPVALDASGRFSVSGSYLLRAYPIAIGPSLPAQFNGIIRDKQMTLTVTVNDTVQKQSTTLGPISVTLGSDPKLGPCPICTVVPKMP